jgi:hypothetical protein
MLFAAPAPDNHSLCGSSQARAYREVAAPAYAEVAGASPGSSEFAQLCSDLDNVMIDCHKPRWDGYGASAISIESYELAKRFIKSLPPGIPRPTVSADPDGCVTFEWQASPRRLVLVSVHPDYRIDYAARFGSAHDRDFGTKPFFDKLPHGLSDVVRRVFQA